MRPTQSWLLLALVLGAALSLAMASAMSTTSLTLVGNAFLLGPR